MFKNKNLVIDTSVLIDNPDCLDEFEKSNIFLTMEVLEELDKHKTRKDHVGKSARQVNRFLDELRACGSLLSGVKRENGSRIFVLDGKGEVLPSFESKSYDNRIISVAKKLKLNLENLIVLSNDIAFRVKCDSLGIDSSRYPINNDNSNNFDNFSGIREIFVSDDDIDYLHKNKKVIFQNYKFEHNECIILKSENSSGIGIAKGDGLIKKVSYVDKKGFSCEGVRPRSAEQAFAMELMLDEDIDLVTLTGKAGCGKTLLSIAAAMHGLHNGKYNKIILSRPIESSSKDIGYLPGDKFEKMLPWVQPIFDNLEAIYGKKGNNYIDQMLHKGTLEVEALTYIRGRSLPNTVFIIDEAQNINYSEAKALITRMGEGSKIILIGDLEQIDAVKLNKNNSGLSNTISIFKKFDRAAHISLKRGERSSLATFAAENM